MAERVTLHGYRYSVYHRVVRMVLFQKAVEHAVVEVDPFGDLPAGYLDLHPFGRVPILTHGGFTVYETGAITRYLDRAFPGPALQPSDPMALARMDQVIAIIDSYGYWPMVRQVFSHRVFRPLAGQAADEETVRAGALESHRVMAALDRIAFDGLVLSGRSVTLADCHLAAMMDYFVRAAEGKAILSEYQCLGGWWEVTRVLPMLQATDPGLQSLVARDRTETAEERG